MKVDCPLLKNKGRIKRRAFKATLDDSDLDSSENEQEEVANMCFMETSDNEVCSSDDFFSDEESSSPTYNELETAYANLSNLFDQLASKYKNL
jgi:hypothetical protein